MPRRWGILNRQFDRVPRSFRRLVFVGAGSNTAGYFYAFDAETGEELWKYNTGSGVFASPAVFSIDGEEFITVASGGGSRGRRGGDLILTFALPDWE